MNFSLNFTPLESLLSQYEGDANFIYIPSRKCYMKLYHRIQPTRKRKEIREAVGEILPFYISLMVSLIIILFVPWITLVLPNLLMK